MILTQILVTLASAAGVLADTRAIVEKLSKLRDRAQPRFRDVTQTAPRAEPSSAAESPFLNARSQKFAVNGKEFPGIPFDIGESYAGLLPITANESDPNTIFFWFFPSSNPSAEKEIALWFQGGPGCSSLTGLLQENGPFLWPPGVAEPYPNPYSWSNLTNMVWIDQPYGIGLARGNTTVKDPIEAAHQFMQFWKHFVRVFSIQGYKINLIGESYGGATVSYFAHEMLAANDTQNFNLVSAQLQDAYIGDLDLQTQIPSITAAQRLNNILFLNQSFMEAVTKKASDCGILPYYNEHIDAYPPKGPFPPLPNLTSCDVADDFFEAYAYTNPCLNPYHITDVCPFLPSAIGFRSYAVTPTVFFNRTDVQAALHVPPAPFEECAHPPGLLYDDATPPPAQGPLPGLIPRLNRTVISFGGLDFALFTDGGRLVIQNMTWAGLQGFQTQPTDEANLFVPYHWGLKEAFLTSINGEDDLPIPFTQTAGAGLLGTWHTERGLTFVNVFVAGHQLPQYAPGAAYRILEYQLGRIESLDQRGEFTG